MKTLQHSFPLHLEVIIIRVYKAFCGLSHDNFLIYTSCYNSAVPTVMQPRQQLPAFPITQAHSRLSVWTLASPSAWDVLHLLILSSLETLGLKFTSPEFQFPPGLTRWDLTTKKIWGNYIKIILCRHEWQPMQGYHPWGKGCPTRWAPHSPRNILQTMV